MLRRALAWLLAGVISAGAFPYATSTLVHSNASFSASYADFDWVWSEVDQIQASARFVAITNSTNMVRFRLAFPQSGPSYLTLDSGSVTQSSGLNWSLLITNQLPTRSYFAEFQLMSNNVAIRTLAKGRVNVQSSVFGGTNAAIYTILKELPGYVVTNGMTNVVLHGVFSGTFDVTNSVETDPIWATVSNTVTAGAALGATAVQAEVDPIWSAVSNAVTAGAAMGATAVQAEVDPIWSAVSNTVTAGAALGATAVQTESDPIWSAVSNTVTAGAALGATAVQTETDPGFAAVSNALSIAANNGQTAFGWGNHATNGYLTAAATSQLVTASVTNGLASVAYVDAATGAVVVTETDPIYTTALNTTNILAYRSSAGAWLFQDFEGTDGLVYVGGVDFLLAQKDVFATSNHFINLKGTVTGYPELRGRGPSLENIPWMMNGGFIATNAGSAGAGYYAMSNGAWTTFSASAIPDHNGLAGLQGGGDGNYFHGTGTIGAVGYQAAELDPVWGGVSGSVVAAANNGQTAFGWGNHADAGYASTNPSYVWQGSAVVTGSHTEAISGIATQIGAAIWLITNSATIQAGTGSVSVTSTGNYLVALSYDKLYAENTGMNPGLSVVFYEDRISDTQIVIWAACDAAGMGSYFAWVSNIVAYYYDRSGMEPQSITNDAPGIVTRVDPVSDFTTDVRRVINVASLVEYVDSQEDEIALHAWDYTPGGDVRPDSRMFTVDQPMVQQGQITYLQSGDYYCQSYSGTEWVSTPTGSVWRIGPSGTTAFEINGTNHGLHVNSFSITGATGFLVIATNYVTSTPIIEHTSDLLYPQWLIVSGQTMYDATNYWLGTVPISTNRGYYRAMSFSGESRIKSYYKHEMRGGLNLYGCPTDTNGLSDGDVWSSNGFIRIYP